MPSGLRRCRMRKCRPRSSSSMRMASRVLWQTSWRLERMLSGLALDPTDLRLALVEAGEGRIGNLADTVRLICYGFDPAAGIYTLSVHRLLLLVSVLSSAALAAAIGLMLREEARQK